MEQSSRIQSAGLSKARVRQLVIGGVVSVVTVVAVANLFVADDPVASATMPAAAESTDAKPQAVQPSARPAEKWYLGETLRNATENSG